MLVKKYGFSQNRKAKQIKGYKTIIVMCSLISLITIGFYNWHETVIAIEDTSYFATQQFIKKPTVLQEAVKDTTSTIKTAENAILKPTEAIENETVEQQIRRIAKENDFAWPDYLVRLAFCESTLNPNAINKQGNYPHYSQDRGLFQINSYWHSEVSDECAYDVNCSTNFAIKMIMEGRQFEWVCAKKI